jgi:hypothetical protein
LHRELAEDAESQGPRLPRCHLYSCSKTIAKKLIQ